MSSNADRLDFKEKCPVIQTDYQGIKFSNLSKKNLVIHRITIYLLWIVLPDMHSVQKEVLVKFSDLRGFESFKDCQLKM